LELVRKKSSWENLELAKKRLNLVTKVSLFQDKEVGKPMQGKELGKLMQGKEAGNSNWKLPSNLLETAMV